MSLTMRDFTRETLDIQEKKKESTKFQKIAAALEVLEKERHQLKKHIKVLEIQLSHLTSIRSNGE